MDIGNITAAFNSCIRGTVTDSNGNPIGNVTVRSSAGTEAITDRSGYYCLKAVGGVPITVFVIGRPSVTVLSQTNTSCSAGDCAVADIKVEYPKEGSYVGLMNVTLNKQSYLTKVTQYLISPSAIFASFTDNPISVVNDQCSVHTYQYNFSQEQHGNDNLPQINWSGLDPGAPGLFQSVDKAVDLIRMSDTYFQEIGTVQPWMYSTFILDYTNPLYTTNEQPNFDASWPGGFDIGAFSVSGQIPPQLEVTSPEITQTLYGSTFDFNPEQDMNIVWNAPETPVPGSFIEVTLSGTSYIFNGDREVANVVVINCTLMDDGSHVIPKELLQQLPVGSINQPAFFNLTISRCYLQEFPVPLVKGGNGKFLVNAQTIVTAYKSTNIPVPVK